MRQFQKRNRGNRMSLYGYCPGTGLAALAIGSLHAAVGFAGMLVGGALYALSYTWIEAHIQNIGALGKVRLPEWTGIPDWVWFALLTGAAGTVFWWLETRGKSAPAHRERVLEAETSS